MATPILNIPTIADNQLQKEAAVNNAIFALERAANASLSVDLSSGDVTLTTDEFTRHAVFAATGQSTPATLTVPLTSRVFAVLNNGDDDLTIAGATGPGVTLLVGDGALLIASEAGVVSAVSGGGGGGGGGSISITDEGSLVSSSVTQINFTGEAVVASDMGGGVVDVSITGGGGGSYTITAWAPGTFTSGQVVYGEAIPAPGVFYGQDYAGSYARLLVAPTADVTFSIKRWIWGGGIIQDLGTITFAAGQVTATITSVGAFSVFQEGDYFFIESASGDATAAGLMATFPGTPGA